MSDLNGRTLTSLKQAAKQLAREKQIPHCQALNAIAQAHGYSQWSLLCHAVNTCSISSLACLLRQLYQPNILLLSAQKNIGKSTFAINLVLAALKQDKKVVYLSTHMSETLFKNRLYAIKTLQSQKMLASPAYQLSPDILKACLNSMTFLAQSKLTFIFDSALHIDKLHQCIHTHKAANTVFIIDYIDSMIPVDSQAVSLFHLKKLAKSQQVALFYLSQMTGHDKMLTRHCDYAFQLTRHQRKAKLLTLKSPSHDHSCWDINYDENIGLFQ